jgi:sortase (surface protein transpeptidase)
MTCITRLRAGLAGPVAFIAVLAIATGGWSAYGPVPAPPGTVPTTTWSVERALMLQDPVVVRATKRDAGWDLRAMHSGAAAPRAEGALAPASASKQTARPVVETRSTTVHDSTPSGSLEAFRGMNHFWIPSLGMSYGVRPYACGRTSNPANYMYRWGCAGTNNVYILGHAYSVMEPLYDLYMRGGLRRGMVAIYADAAGRIRAYQVTEWRVVRPTEVAWQIAAQPVPSMTLQTCVGKNSEYRLNVRLVAMN